MKEITEEEPLYELEDGTIVTAEELDEIIKKERKEFFEKYPDAYESKDIDCLDLVMKKEFAEAILKGEKVVEYRAYTRFYYDRIFDKKLTEWGEKNVAEEDMEHFVDYCRPLRKVNKIHFHNYNNSWFLDVEIYANWTVVVTDASVVAMEEDYGCTELKELNDELNAKGETDRPIFFYFAIGDILDTNLERK